MYNNCAASKLCCFIGLMHLKYEIWLISNLVWVSFQYVLQHKNTIRKISTRTVHIRKTTMVIGIWRKCRKNTDISSSLTGLLTITMGQYISNVSVIENWILSNKLSRYTKEGIQFMLFKWKGYMLHETYINL